MISKKLICLTSIVLAISATAMADGRLAVDVAQVDNRRKHQCEQKSGAKPVIYH